MKRKKKSVEKQKPESMKVEEDVMKEEIDEVLSNFVKVECEYLLPLLCDILD